MSKWISSRNLLRRLAQEKTGGIANMLNELRTRPDLVKTAQDVLVTGSEEEKVMALVALQSVAGPEIGAAIRIALSDESARVRVQAIHLIASSGAHWARHDLVAALNDSNGQVRRRAILALAQIDPASSKDLLKDRFTSQDVTDRLAVVEAVSKHYLHGLTNETIAALRDPSSRVRAMAIKALAKIAPSDIATIMELLVDPAEEVRLQVLRAVDFGDLKLPLDALTRMLTDPSPKVRLLAAYNLSRRKDAQTCSSLLSLLDDPFALVRRVAILALGEIGCVEAVPALLEAAQQLTEPEDRVALLNTLGKVDGQAILSLLQASLAHSDPRVRRQAVIACSSVDSPDATALVQERLHSDPSGMVRAQAGLSLAYSARASAQAHLIDALRDDPDPQVRQAAAHGLADMAGSAVTAALRASLHDPEARVRIEVVRSLGHRVDADAIPELIVLKKNETNPQILAEIAAALARIDAPRFGKDIQAGPASVLYDPRNVGRSFAVWLRDPLWYPASERIIFYNTGTAEAVDLANNSKFYHYTVDPGLLHVHAGDEVQPMTITFRVESTGPAFGPRSGYRLMLSADMFFDSAPLEAVFFYMEGSLLSE